ncbi:WW domain binding protein 1-like b isoform X1 [Electrophorus electricus]|nr:WW domain binding protein 1-like b isoform X1 [Electrophorus electricus]
MYAVCPYFCTLLDLSARQMQVLSVVASPPPPQQVRQCAGGRNHSHACADPCCVELHYYQLWWFWLVWAIIFFLSCCCVCHHRHVKHRLQQQQRQHEINLIAYREAHNSTSPPFYLRFLPNTLLPDYEEVMNRPPTPPPPYSASTSAPTACTTSEQQETHCSSRQVPPLPPASELLCSSPTITGYHAHGGHCYKDGSKPQMGSEQGSWRNVTKPMEGSCSTRKQNVCREGQREEEEVPEEKEWSSRRQRHFTGDSGIEVCKCTRGAEGCERKELRTLRSEEHQEGFEESCKGCSLHVCCAEDQSRVVAEQWEGLLS